MSIFVPPRLVMPSEKAILGPGAAAMMTLQPLYTALNATPQSIMRQAQGLYLSDPWIRAAEDTISGLFSTTDWHLEDENDEELENPTGPALDALRLLERPQANLKSGVQLTRSRLWSLTCRDMGVCGNSFWLADQPEMLAGTPNAFVYINPARMTPAEDDAGNLTGWVLDHIAAAHSGIPLSLDEVYHFKLNEPISGHFGIGKVQSAMMKAALTRLGDQHAADVLSAGGRLTGIVSAKSGGTIPDGVFQQLVRDFRTVADSGDAAKRLTVVQGPIDFTRTVATPLELSLIDIMKLSRDDTLALWGVPLSQIGGQTPAGLNSGDVRKYDRAALWQNAIHPRLTAFWEILQYQILDRWQKLGVTVELEIEEPEFDDDSPRYDLLMKSVNLPMRNSERRALIGLDPFGDPVLDDAVYLPATLVEISTTVAPGPASPTQQALGRAAPDEATGEGPDQATDAAGETSAGGAVGKAGPLHKSMLALRANVSKGTTPKMQSGVARFLAEQRHEIAAHLRTLPVYRAKDAAHLWPKRLADDWDRRLTAILRPYVAGIAESVSGHVGEVLPKTGKAGPIGQDAIDASLQSLIDRVLKKGAARVTEINATTRDELVSIVADGLVQGSSMTQLADAIEAGTDLTPLIGRSGGVIGDLGYRAEMIARTETGTAYNEAALESYRDASIEMVQVLDGDGDDICAPWADWTGPIDEAPDPLGHPNCTRDILPAFGPAKAAPIVAPSPLMARMDSLVAAMQAQADRPQLQPTIIFNPPAVSYEASPVTVHPPNVYVEPAVVSVAPAQITVNLPSSRKVVDRDPQGRIIGTHEEPS